jgi:hypothetical protein
VDDEVGFGTVLILILPVSHPRQQKEQLKTINQLFGYIREQGWRYISFFVLYKHAVTTDLDLVGSTYACCALSHNAACKDVQHPCGS